VEQELHQTVLMLHLLVQVNIPLKINTQLILVTGMMELHKYLMKDAGKDFMQQVQHGM
jgi:hypothetical protein